MREHSRHRGASQRGERKLPLLFEFMVDYLNELNEPQQQAVLYNDGALLIVAGAGSGKTRVLTYKIAYLMSEGMPPHNILALTFTNKAAAEMRRRIAAIAGEHIARRLWMGTFHSVFSRILRREAEHLGYTSDFTIYDTADSRNLLKTIIKEMGLDDKVYKPAKIAATISKAKNRLISAQAYAQNKEAIEYDMRAKVPMTAEIYKTYTQRLLASNAMDFDDLLCNTHRLFQQNAEVLARYQQQFQFVLVDEYQDTNNVQHLIVKQLAEVHRRVCVVGDDAQSIYAFRGADITNILEFQQTYPEAKVFKLEQNYRSTQTIVNAANSLIKCNKGQLEKNVFSKNAVGSSIVVEGAYSDFEEGIIVSNAIATLRKKGALWSDIAILYRTNAQSRIFEEALRKKNIPYRIYGGLSFYQRKEVKDVIAYLRMIINPNDEEAFKRIINFPVRGIGATTVGKIADTARLHRVSLWAVLSSPLEFNLGVNGGTAKKLAAFREMIEDFTRQLRELSAYEMAMLVMKQSGVWHHIYQDQSPEGMSRQEHVQELMAGIQEFTDARTEQGEQALLPDFLAEVSLLTDQDTDQDAEAEKVTMLTVHAAKGLEYKHVFVVGMEEELFPSSMALSEYKGVEEERRLFYVALTRAEVSCTLSYARSRFRNGQMQMGQPSRFLKEIDPDCLDIRDTMLSRTFSASREEIPPRSGTTKEVVIPPRTNREPRWVQAHAAIPTAMPDSTFLDLQAGDRILHDRFGEGIVRELSGDVASRKATVEFQNVGTKQLLLKFAKFKKL